MNTIFSRQIKVVNIQNSVKPSCFHDFFGYIQKLNFGGFLCKMNDFVNTVAEVAKNGTMTKSWTMKNVHFFPKKIS